MDHDFTDQERKAIEEGIRGKYAKVARSSEGLFKYPTGCAGLEKLQYDPAIVRSLPESATESFCGVGNPFSLGDIREGEHVLDIGCGGGLDAMVAATLTGPMGEVIGIDMSPEMVKKAQHNLSLTPLTNVAFQEASAEALHLPDNYFDVVISSGVFNLIPDKRAALREVFRVIRPAGRLWMADQILTGALPGETAARVASWAG
jgi:arsenite methyltransferase